MLAVKIPEEEMCWWLSHIVQDEALRVRLYEVNEDQRQYDELATAVRQYYTALRGAQTTPSSSTPTPYFSARRRQEQGSQWVQAVKSTRQPDPN